MQKKSPQKRGCVDYFFAFDIGTNSAISTNFFVANATALLSINKTTGKLLCNNNFLTFVF